MIPACDPGNLIQPPGQPGAVERRAVREEAHDDRLAQQKVLCQKNSSLGAVFQFAVEPVIAEQELIEPAGLNFVALKGREPAVLSETFEEGSHLSFLGGGRPPVDAIDRKKQAGA